MAKFGIALGSGPRGLGFESRHSDQNSGIRKCGFRNFLRVGIRKIKCGADERRRRRLDGGEPLFCPNGTKCRRISTLGPKKQKWLKLFLLFYFLCIEIRKMKCKRTVLWNCLQCVEKPAGVGAPKAPLCKGGHASGMTGGLSQDNVSFSLKTNVNS